MKKLLLLLIFISTAVFADFSGKVIKVIDGDTVDILTIQHKKVRIRLVDIDAPERGQPYVNQSRQFLASLIAGKIVLVKDQGQDIYHRTLGTIYYQNENINAKMVSNGYVWAYRLKNKTINNEMVILESQAKQNRLGLWQDKNPIAPWDYRHGK